MNRKYIRRLALENLYNVRDLGGFYCQDGSSTRWQSFFRADNLGQASEKDLLTLQDFGVKTVIDLRGNFEIAQAPNPTRNHSDFNYYNISLIDEDVTDTSRKGFDLERFEKMSLGDFYIHMLDKKQDKIREIFETIYKHQKEGAVLYHCTAGKDRTGVTSMLLLGLAGVGKADLVNDYSSTDYFLQQNPNRGTHMNYPELSQEKKEVIKTIMSSKAEYMEKAYLHLLESYGSITGYLSHSGISDHILEEVRKGFTEK